MPTEVHFSKRNLVSFGVTTEETLWAPIEILQKSLKLKEPKESFWIFAPYKT